MKNKNEFTNMLSFKTNILKFQKQGEKTGWTYIQIPAELAQKLNPNVKKSYPVKGFLDRLPISGMNLLPMGEDDFILALNANIRKGIKKKQGDSLFVKIELDPNKYQLNTELIRCLEENPRVHSIFQSLTPAHQSYFSKWIDHAKTLATKQERIAACYNAMVNKQSYPEMVKERKQTMRLD
ncbi:MAG: DUF1905 domain-containing protein [Saprospiraceae bacterium]|nr:DUF1905 domain-containing protein [Saprospiraceae bacterium]